MPRVQDAIPSLDCRAWKGRSNLLLLSALRFAPESRGAEIVDRLQKCLECIDRSVEKAQPLLKARNAFRQLGYPGFSRPGDRCAKSYDRREQEKNQQHRPQRFGHTQSFKRAQGWLHQEIEHDREDQWENNSSAY